MRGLVNLILSLVLAGLLINGVFAGLRASMVRGNAEVYIAPEVCPTKVVAGVCAVRGDESEDFISGDRTITLPDRSVVHVPRKYVRGASWDSENVYYKLEPLVFLTSAGVVTICAFGISSLNRRRPRA
jgi:hypothetical protein